ncbi:MAG: hypothetical protein KDC84_05500 [Crocinitomicaceae bacterium]|nr:hypothetical protein [Crocinitomicaceae bacterium]
MIRSYIFIFILLGCSSEKTTPSQAPEKESQPKNKSPKEFALEYCECMKNDQATKSCESILSEFQSTFGKQNKEAEKEFSIEMQNCL